MSEEVETPEAEETDLTPPAKKSWWQFESQEEAQEWANDKIQKRLAREKSKFDPIVNERDTLKARVAELEPLEDSKKTDTQRWETERETLNKELEDLRAFQKQTQRDNLVREIAEDKGLPAKFFTRVRGDDSDAITADIEDLLNVINDGKPTKPASRKPIEQDEKTTSKAYGGGGSKDETDDKAIVQNVVKKARENRNRTFVR